MQGLSPDTCQRDLADAAVALRSGALWVAANTDLTLPSVRGPLPGNGAFVAVLRLVTGLEPLVAGKPDPALHRESVERVAARTPARSSGTGSTPTSWARCAAAPTACSC